ncbi:hypothetical protein D7X33_20230 [Butyricicoccus sp. 1XD8-22]|nr:hypothetical protein D7X33_20230 [Butyricicoccus sp. 1XD8-22]
MQYKVQQMKLEDLYTAFLLGGAKKTTVANKYTVVIQQERLEILHYYLERFGLRNSFLFEVHEEELSQCVVVEFETTLLVMRIYKEWYYGNMVVAISPMYLNLNSYLLWISIFGEKRKSFIRLSNEHISQDAKKTLSTLFTELTGVELSTNAMQFAIHDVKLLILLAIRTKRPVYEVKLLTEFLSPREFKKLQGILNESTYFFHGGMIYEGY